MKAFLKNQVANYGKWDFLVFTILTLLSILSGNTTVFYLIYFFWWNELIRLVVDWFFFKKNPNATVVSTQQSIGFESFFLMGIYFVFLVVFFGFIANHDQMDILATNMEILSFRNWFFNANLLFVVAERIFLHRSEQELEIYFGGFTPSMIVLHVSIILGAMMIFFVVKRFPEVFTPENLWGSVVIAIPFLILRWVVAKFIV
ncbi:hypothetical protein QWY85_19345 [Neolewinella lacunae]|uniref:Uncharacterized protein n=1 Tax=Neolewinella lacunae TaxID=1517758 RepID=A0A923T6E0_9BACT|nr:hypothetical protein [Neolewinella lacunae]MBC6993325.1 hypothetical protein [Neolewinella lacunae]MDN3636834.1 hypothetical protein [Neolewinella lacunae]